MWALGLCCMQLEDRIGMKQRSMMISYFMGLIHRTHADLLALRPPPESHKLGRVGDMVKVVDDVIELVCLLYFAQTERRGDCHAYVEDDAGAAKAAKGGKEEVWLVISGAGDLGSIGQEQMHGLHMGGENPVVDARPVGGCGQHTGEGLLGD